MPMPWTYRHGDVEWRRFLADIREVMGTPSDNVAFTTAEGAFRAFRARLTVEQAADFAQVLPAMPRALFLEGWRPAPPLPWADGTTYVAEVKALRRDHNFATDLGLTAVAVALHRAVGPDRLAIALDAIGPEARAFWAVDGYGPEALAAHGF
ncbi:DUF2267 domain-containing protein [Roseicyclus mahoneyensis]|uniref:Uncharacterized protein (DUF2267 family) n=1 Tax=Roseicyclus mahoneyensis TaxID=164332 RepID=A0A316H0D1_9RHOB|nr:DUF2267 domain-containing protein [Roseicyclus mahoneyensis]PWK60860.1 uncharacterized protein (DUF2267 family) [Roseicyclus mahoneyensis]